MKSDTVMLAFHVKREFADAIDDARVDSGESRSQLIRIAIRRELERRGYQLARDAHLGIDRAGVGGTPTHRPKSPPANGGESSLVEESPTPYRTAPAPAPQAPRKPPA